MFNASIIEATHRCCGHSVVSSVDFVSHFIFFNLVQFKILLLVFVIFSQTRPFLTFSSFNRLNVKHFSRYHSPTKHNFICPVLVDDNC